MISTDLFTGIISKILLTNSIFYLEVRAHTEILYPVHIILYPVHIITNSMYDVL